MILSATSMKTYVKTAMLVSGMALATTALTACSESDDKVDRFEKQQTELVNKLDSTIVTLQTIIDKNEKEIKTNEAKLTERTKDKLNVEELEAKIKEQKYKIAVQEVEISTGINPETRGIDKGIDKGVAIGLLGSVLTFFLGWWMGKHSSVKNNTNSKVGETQQKL